MSISLGEFINGESRVIGTMEENSPIETEYRKRVDDLVELLNDLGEIDQRIETENLTEPRAEYWEDIVAAVQDHVGEIGLPLDPENLDRRGDPYLNAPGWQGDHIGINVEWRDEGLYVQTHILPHFAGHDIPFYRGFVSNLTTPKIDERTEWAKSLSPEKSLA